MTIKQEVKKLLQQRAVSIVDERIIPETLDRVIEWTDELLRDTPSLDPNNDQQVKEVFELLYKGLLQETIAQLTEPLSERRKKLFEKK